MQIPRIKIYILTFSLFLLYGHTTAQKNQWTVKAGQSIEEVLGDRAIYRYQQFLQGRVYYRNGSVSGGLLNLNRVTGEMEFVAPSGDTLAIADEVTINYIAIQKDTFCFDKVYIELIHDSGSAKLGKLEIIKLMDVKKEGAYGQMNSTAAISTASSLYAPRQSYKLVESVDLTLQQETVYFIGDSQNHFLPAVRKNINKMFSEKSSTIEPFIRENKIELTKEGDLVKLIDFLAKQ